MSQMVKKIIVNLIVTHRATLHVAYGIVSDMFSVRNEIAVGHWPFSNTLVGHIYYFQCDCNQ